MAGEKSLKLAELDYSNYKSFGDFSRHPLSHPLTP